MTDGACIMQMAHVIGHATCVRFWRAFYLARSGRMEADKAAERRARKAAAARARRQNPAVREREAEACRQAARRRRENPAVLEREAESARRRREDPAVREREAEAARRRREDPAVREREAEAARRRREDPAVREREAEAARRRREDPAVREREAEAARRRREEDLQNVRDREAARKRAYQQADPDVVRAREVSAKRIRRAQPEVAGPDVLLRRCPCGQVLNTNDTSQLPAWEVRRDVSIQCGLQRMPPLPLPMEIILSTTTGDNAEEGTRLSQVLSPVEKEEDHGTDKALNCERLFRCHLCKYSTPKLQRLRYHLVSHSTEKPFKCEVCPVAFKCLESYNAHMCKHTGEKLYQCDLCPYSTAYKKSHLEHKRTH
ncbi:uncharacterized protein LOC119372247 isoform X3 [Rhipicephalus sanguineus]|uniref:uncharacterized protein LOC119372247 isoform X3 n=1 Tax=Rhipicephalus sanguineus TaxID=34632 RepID=UPI0020C3D8A4|nr:uncharacterized protein LOC119372247 isoform X3 [Rhipicephalus sanguineus]